MKKIFAFSAAVLLLAGLCGAGVRLDASAAPKQYDNYIDVSTYGSGLMIEPTGVVEPDSFDRLSSLSGKEKPSSVILTPDKEMNIVLGGETRSLQRTFDSYVKGKFVPVVRLSSETVAPFLTWLKNTYTVKDMMAVSSELPVLKALHEDETGSLVNTVYDLTGETLSSDRYAEWDHVGEANAQGCNILMYDGSDPNLAVAAEYVEALTRVCWAEVETEEEAISAIAAGCYGVVAKDGALIESALSHFEKPGFARAQYVAAHRGITRYANEQSLTGIMASANEGATHVEIDIQVTADRKLLINHDSDTRATTGFGGTYFANATSAQLEKFKLDTYSKKYGDSFASLEDVIVHMAKTDVILIIELKLDNGSAKAVDELKAIELLKELTEKYPEIEGHWYAITFYAPYAEKMRELLPEIPVGYLGGASSDKENAENKPGWGGGHVAMDKIAEKIAFLHKYNVGLDENMSAATNTTAQNYLARGYTQNTWTFEDVSHFSYRANVATSNAAEECAMLVKSISSQPLTLTQAQIDAGKATAVCTTYNGWQVEKECDLIVVSREGNRAKALLYLAQEGAGGKTFGLYGGLTDITVS